MPWHKYGWKRTTWRNQFSSTIWVPVTELQVLWNSLFLHSKCVFFLLVIRNVYFYYWLVKCWPIAGQEEIVWESQTRRLLGRRVESGDF